MAKCDLCGRDMLAARGCGISQIHAGGKVYKRIPMGGEGDPHAGLNTAVRCHDCNAARGEYHHWGCDMERCPACGRQLISCECEDAFAEGGPTRDSKPN